MGESAGHPFRGNQWTAGQAAAHGRMQDAARLEDYRRNPSRGVGHTPVTTQAQADRAAYEKGILGRAHDAMRRQNDPKLTPLERTRAAHELSGLEEERKAVGQLANAKGQPLEDLRAKLQRNADALVVAAAHASEAGDKLGASELVEKAAGIQRAIDSKPNYFPGTVGTHFAGRPVRSSEAAEAEEKLKTYRAVDSEGRVRRVTVPPRETAQEKRDSDRALTEDQTRAANEAALRVKEIGAKAVKAANAAKARGASIEVQRSILVKAAEEIKAAAHPDSLLGMHRDMKPKRPTLKETREELRQRGYVEGITSAFPANTSSFARRGDSSPKPSGIPRPRGASTGRSGGSIRRSGWRRSGT